MRRLVALSGFCRYRTARSSRRARGRRRCRSRLAAAPTASSNAGYVPLTLSYDKPAVGRHHRSRDPPAGLPPGRHVDLVVGHGDRRMGHRGLLPFPRQEVLRDARRRWDRFSVDAAGRLDARFAIPEDFGGVHEVIALVDGKPVAQNGIEVTQTFEMTPASGPVGTPIELKVKGLGLADDGEHVGGELGQPGARLRVGGRHARDRRSRASAPPVPSAITWSSSTPAGRARLT